MSVLQFIASLVSSMAWPVVVLVAALAFRKHIPKIASGIFSGRLLKKVKLGPVEAEWEALDNAEREIAAGATQEDGGPGDLGVVSESDFADILKLAEISPSATVLMAFQRVELETRSALMNLGYPFDQLKRIGPLGLFSKVVDAGLVSPEVGDAMQSLRELKNRVSHESDADLTKGRAIQYALVAAEALAALRRGQSPENVTKPTASPT